MSGSVHQFLALLGLTGVLDLFHVGVRASCLAVLADVLVRLVGHVDNRLLALSQECLSLPLAFSVLRHEQFQLIPVGTGQRRRLLVDLRLQATNRQLKQLILPLGLEHLLMQKIALLLQIVGLALLFLDFFGLLVLFFFHPDLVVPYTLNGLL